MKGNVQHLNYCRQAKECFSKSLSEKKDHQYREVLESVIRQIDDAVKFSLPRNGRTIGDNSFRGLREDMELNIPFKTIALEYERDELEDTSDGYGGASKVIVIARDVGEKIAMTILLWIKYAKIWGPMPAVLIPKSEFFGMREKDRVFVNAQWHPSIPFSDIEDEIGALFDFLNAMACKNVHVEKSQAKASKQGKKVKSALPFDDYHYLTVDVPGKSGARVEGLGGSHRSPREHLRRGHIRRLESGPIWVNACVVNAGIGGKVGKSYLLRKAS